jgi:hypothetical protein
MGYGEPEMRIRGCEGSSNVESATNSACLRVWENIGVHNPERPLSALVNPCNRSSSCECLLQGVERLVEEFLRPVVDFRGSQASFMAVALPTTVLLSEAIGLPPRQCSYRTGIAILTGERGRDSSLGSQQRTSKVLVLTLEEGKNRDYQQPFRWGDTMCAQLSIGIETDDFGAAGHEKA